MELLIALFVLFFLLATMTVVGHVIWVIIATILRWIFSDNQEPAAPRQTRIFEAPPPVQSRDDLAAFERQLVRFYADGKISDEVYEQLLARLRFEREPRTTEKREPAPSVEV